MKKHALFLILVLAISSTAFGICRVNAFVSQPSDGMPVDGDDVAIRVVANCSGDCEFVRFEQSGWGSVIYVDMYLTCDCLNGSSEVNKGKWILRPATCGQYIVFVRVWCQYEGCACWPYSCFRQPVFCGQTALSVRVGCEQCGSYPCACLRLPCWPCPTTDED